MVRIDQTGAPLGGPVMVDMCLSRSGCGSGVRGADRCRDEVALIRKDDARRLVSGERGVDKSVR